MQENWRPIGPPNGDLETYPFLFLFYFPFNCSASPIFDLQSDALNSGTCIILITIAHSYLIIFKHPDPL